MSLKDVLIRFEGVEEWEETRDEVDKILQELTGTDEYPSTRSLPPIIFGAQLDEDGMERLRRLDGVIVQVPEEEDDD
ncbi:uncharacterized protein ACHE_50557A [Aspergillus chevalieri]|uniref:Uncharacterized protein n=1 Tax=Aspergillus chevalieri TaxID=182096 RepID=A0A7R7ZQ79_ASPCH|nr:uncharacterized protein ACHE_50557A [Aspergillus chevalieri]BCR89359.1 hypothetical protein ACHE_50557A [Aspergillus chevalieri]